MYLHICLDDNKEAKIDDAFRQIYEYIDGAILPDEFSTYRGSKQNPVHDFGKYPISNQILHVNIKKQETEVKTKDHQYEQFLKIQQFFKSINTTHPENQNRVLVHCAMGMSRSATGAIMFLMKLFNCCFDDAFEFIKTQRQKTDPNEGFVEKLRYFEFLQM